MHIPRIPSSESRHACAAPARQRGIVLLYALIAMVLLMVSGLALVRGMGTALAIGGNFTLRRDLVNQGELGVADAKALFSTGGPLGTASARNNSLASANYSATTLASSAGSDYNGIPLALLSDTAFAAIGQTGNDIAGTFGISIRYVIDRQCSTTGAPTQASCMTFTAPCKAGSSACSGPQQLAQGAGAVAKPVYRITIRITGPKNAMTFLQTTVEA
jgi:Tfp pilus assembly protein PilX